MSLYFVPLLSRYPDNLLLTIGNQLCNFFYYFLHKFKIFFFDKRRQRCPGVVIASAHLYTRCLQVVLIISSYTPDYGIHISQHLSSTALHTGPFRLLWLNRLTRDCRRIKHDLRTSFLLPWKKKEAKRIYSI